MNNFYRSKFNFFPLTFFSFFLTSAMESPVLALPTAQSFWQLIETTVPFLAFTRTTALPLLRTKKLALAFLIFQSASPDTVFLTLASFSPTLIKRALPFLMAPLPTLTGLTSFFLGWRLRLFYFFLFLTKSKKR